MKIVLILFVVAFCYASTTDEEWKAYKAKFNKNYPNPAIDEMRKLIFLHNKALVEEHNRLYDEGLKSFKLAVNKFADMTKEEMEDYHGFIGDKIIPKDPVV
ncbi:unnamed protein product [Nezara viridula]|uniref:Cathepsin propeptide inhibitor domain-containing protein n=1 Tax=Nezara viridula TaxID=85310 RepID=A0A9P0EBR8_NEZVI|nr:unnamed protein product [Nezara viridula]